jgi:hypothetical protein
MRIPRISVVLLWVGRGGGTSLGRLGARSEITQKVIEALPETP